MGPAQITLGLYRLAGVATIRLTAMTPLMIRLLSNNCVLTSTRFLPFLLCTTHPNLISTGWYVRKGECQQCNSRPNINTQHQHMATPYSLVSMLLLIH